jgi:hypothetical protein
MMRDRAGVVERAAEVEVESGATHQVYSSLAIRELARDDADEVVAHLTVALRAHWLEEQAAALAVRPFVTDAEATAALERLGKDVAARDAWVAARLDGFRKAVAPAPPPVTIASLTDAVRAMAPPKRRRDGAFEVEVAMPTRSDVLSLGRWSVVPGAMTRCSVVSQGHFHPRHLFVSVASDVAIPCAKCKHEPPEGRKLSDLRVNSIMVGSTHCIGAFQGVPADLFSVHRDLSKPGPDPTYEAALPGITISVTVEYSEAGRSWSDKRDPITFEVAMLGEYIAGANSSLTWLDGPPP